MRKVTLLLAAALLTLPGAVLGDIVVLKNGSRMEGVVSEHGNKLHVALNYGHVVLPKSLVDHVIICDTPRQKLKKKLAAADQNSIEQLTSLQQWCAENDLKEEAGKIALKIGRLVLGKKETRLDMKDAGAIFDFALWCKRSGYPDSVVESYLWKVVSLKPEHSTAREMLGQGRFRGQWLKKTEIAGIRRAEYDKEMRLKGMVKYKGQWLIPNAASCLKQMEDIEEQRDDLDRDRQHLEDDRRDAAREREEVAAARSTLYFEQNRLQRREDVLERTALRQAALAQRLAFHRDELARLRLEVDRLKDELEREKESLREQRRETDREKHRLQQLRCRLECEWRQLRQAKKKKNDCRPVTDRPINPKKKIGSEEHTPGRQSSTDREREASRRKRVRR